MRRNSGPSGHHESVAPSLKKDEALVGFALGGRLGYSWGEAGSDQLYGHMEIRAFLGVHSEFQPAAVSQLAACILPHGHGSKRLQHQTTCCLFLFWQR